MVRHDLFVNVPTLFRCPISLDVMTSPVSLCTGVTYDRSSIQRWLDGGNNTCPATMQVLHSKEFVPNLTLQRLIQVWSDSLEPSAPPLPPPDSPLTRDLVLATVETLENSSGDDRTCSLSRIWRFAIESEDNCIFLAKIDGFASLLLSFMNRVEEKTERNTDLVELAVMLFGLVFKRLEDREELIRSLLHRDSGCLISIRRVIERGTMESKLASISILESVAINEELNLAIAETDGLLLKLLDLISPQTDSNLIEATLSCLTQLSVPKSVRMKLLNLQAIKSLSNLLAASNSSPSLIEKALRLLETVSSCRKGRLILSNDPECMELILRKAFKVSSAATEVAVAILWSLCCAFREESARTVVRRCNGVARILVVMQSDYSPAVRQMCGDLLRVFRVSSDPRLSNYDTKTTHIMPF